MKKLVLIGAVSTLALWASMASAQMTMQMPSNDSVAASDASIAASDALNGNSLLSGNTVNTNANQDNDNTTTTNTNTTTNTTTNANQDYDTKTTSLSVANANQDNDNTATNSGNSTYTSTWNANQDNDATATNSGNSTYTSDVSNREDNDVTMTSTKTVNVSDNDSKTVNVSKSDDDNVNVTKNVSVSSSYTKVEDSFNDESIKVTISDNQLNVAVQNQVVSGVAANYVNPEHETFGGGYAATGGIYGTSIHDARGIVAPKLNTGVANQNTTVQINASKIY
jgi:hypothetical protein